MKRDPFADENVGHEERVKNALEKENSYVEATVTPVPQEGSLLPYTRIIDLADDLRLVPLDDLQDEDLIIHTFERWEGELGEFFTLEVSYVSDPSEGHFLTNCGGKVAMRRIESAFQKLQNGLATGPLVASFSKLTTNSGRSFWRLS